MDEMSTPELPRAARLDSFPAPQGLYDPRFEHDACGVSFVANIKGVRSHELVLTGVGALCNLEHRGAVRRRAEHR